MEFDRFISSNPSRVRDKKATEKKRKRMSRLVPPFLLRGVDSADDKNPFASA